MYAYVHSCASEGSHGSLAKFSAFKTLRRENSCTILYTKIFSYLEPISIYLKFSAFKG
jgi:hypothetical protein